MDFQDIQKSLLFRKILKRFIGEENFEIVVRPASFIVRLKSEDQKFVKRIILLPPHGFTADKIDLLNPHPEARKARMKILGKINPTKKGFKPLVRGLKFNFSLTRNIPTEEASAYARFSEKNCGSQLKSWENWFYVVKENGWGNFHNLINLSDEWVLAILEKDLTDRKEVEIRPYLKKLSVSQSEKLLELLKEIRQSRDRVFGDKGLIKEFLGFPSKVLTPVSIQMLNVQETGKHEPCTFFALLLQIAKKNHSLVLEEVKRAIKLKSAPYYYLEDLYRKLGKS